MKLGVRPRTAFPVVAALYATSTLIWPDPVQADTFGTGGNEFTIDFVNIGNAGNGADTTGYGAVPYEYRMGVYEISQNAIDQAIASGLQNVSPGLGAWGGDKPATDITWFEMAAFVNWLNTSTGNDVAYNLSWSANVWSMTAWNHEQAWQLGGENLYRNRGAFYFLPNENEWYKAAYHNPAGGYFSYPTGSSTAPDSITSGTNYGTAVFDRGLIIPTEPANVSSAGGLSPHGTMAQGGNVWEWTEAAYSGLNVSCSEPRTARGGWWSGNEIYLRSLGGGEENGRIGVDPATESWNIGLRVASVPEPSTYALLLMTGAGALWFAGGGGRKPLLRDPSAKTSSSSANAQQ